MPSVPTQDHTTTVQNRLAALPRFFGYPEVLACYDDEEDALVDAWCTGALPTPIRRVCEDTLGPAAVQLLLLRRLVRDQAACLEALRALLSVLRSSVTSIPSEKEPHA